MKQSIVHYDRVLKIIGFQKKLVCDTSGVCGVFHMENKCDMCYVFDACHFKIFIDCWISWQIEKTLLVFQDLFALMACLCLPTSSVLADTLFRCYK